MSLASDVPVTGFLRTLMIKLVLVGSLVSWMPWSKAVALALPSSSSTVSGNNASHLPQHGSHVKVLLLPTD
jgi:hypothetical protein